MIFMQPPPYEGKNSLGNVVFPRLAFISARGQPLEFQFMWNVSDWTIREALNAVGNLNDLYGERFHVERDDDGETYLVME